MIRSLKEDLYRYEGLKCHCLLTQLRYILFVPGVQYIYFLRHAQEARNCISRFLWNVLLKLCSFKFGIQIPTGVRLGKGFRISHWGAIVMNPAVVLGNNCNIAQNVLIGNSLGHKKGVPKIGNNVCINANAVVVGGVYIADNVLIAPGAFINFDVPPNSIVIGNPGKIIPREFSPTDKYIVYKVEDYQ